MQQDREFSVFLQRQLSLGRSLKLKLKGDSMLPEYKQGDFLEINPYAFSALCPGDVIAFNSHFGVLVHRVVKVLDDGLLTAGDNNVLLDEPVSQQDFLGLVAKAGVNKASSVNAIASNKTFQVWLPEPLMPALVSYTSIKLKPFSQSQVYVQSFKPKTSLGISPYGLYSEDQLLKELPLPELSEVVFFGNFARAKEGFFPVEKLKFVARLKLFEQDLSYYQLGYLQAQEQKKKTHEALIYFSGLLSGIGIQADG